MKNYPAKALAGIKSLLNRPIVDADTSELIVHTVQVLLEASIKSFLISLAEHDYHDSQDSHEDMEQDTRYISDEDRLYVLKRDGYKCVKCGSTSNLELDHKIPFSRGGATSAKNLQVLCRTCNRKKGLH